MLSTQNHPMYPPKSPVYSQKSPIHSPKSPIYLQKSPTIPFGAPLTHSTAALATPASQGVLYRTWLVSHVIVGLFWETIGLFCEKWVSFERRGVLYRTWYVSHVIVGLFWETTGLFCEKWVFCERIWISFERMYVSFERMYVSFEWIRGALMEPLGSFERL